jgi:hypothetical protein
MLWNLKTLALATTTTLTLLAGSAWYAYVSGLEVGRRQVEIEWQEAMRLQATAESEEVMKAQQRERALQELMAQQRKAHQREINRIVREYAALVDSLRDRPEARSDSPTGLPDAPDSGTGCTGAGLSRSDAAFLAGFAADAARAQAALQACQRAYDEVRQSLTPGQFSGQ